MLDAASNGAPVQQVALHDNTIRSVHSFQSPNSNAPLIATGSWDRTVRIWDLRQSNPAASMTCNERVYSMDVAKKYLVIGTAERHIHIVDLSNLGTFYKTMQSALQNQTRVVSCIVDSSGFGVGSIGGRCGIQFIDKERSG
jgi:mRNA export factor